MHVQRFALLGVASDQYGSLLQIACKIREEVWKIDDFLQVIQAVSCAREASENIKVNTVRPVQRSLTGPSSKASSLFSSNGKIQCVHFCSKISRVEDHKDMLLKAG